MARGRLLRAGLGIVALSVSLAACGTACPAALFTGTLVRQGDALLAQADDGPPTPIRWPEGVEVRSVAGRLVVLDGFGRVLAREGDSVRLGGGMTADDRIGVCGLIEVASPAPS